ncbi:hypothetical protein F9L07_25255 [Pimelobacter simplex]|uniref:Uncharacterized protein n=1 Tax=Nocardioides simplex TaxID=2045 RepID=A0A7J5DSR7_NOCSI|nr:hypothetical protein [Pimelobacter simplex]KAB2807980.1 hypothetical protein F9L07_25255 [Pimelobacter simplex]
MSQPHSLMWGDLRLAGDTVDPDAEFVIEAMADRTKLGTAKALTEFVKSLQVDGSLAVMNGHDNAETVLQLRVSAPDGSAAGPAVAKAAAALAANAAADPIPPLMWISPLEDAATCVYDVYAADPVRDEGNDWDIEEKLRECRYFTVTMSRHPFSRPPNPVVVPALPPAPPTPTTVDIDTCDATTNWTAKGYGYGPATRRNIVANPSGETNVNLWAKGPASTDATILRDTTQFAVGTASIRVAKGAGQVSLIRHAFPVTAGLDYAFQASARPTISYPGTNACTASITFWSGPNGTGSPLGGPADFKDPVANTWQTYQGTGKAPSGAVSATFDFSFYDSNNRSAGTVVYYLDKVMVEQANIPGGYVDGSLPDTATLDYVWEGTAHASPSLAVYTVATLQAASGHVDAIGAASPGYSGTRTLSLTRSAAVNMSTSPYLRVSAALTVVGGTASGPTFKIGTGTPAPIEPVGFSPSAIAGYVDYFFATGNFDTLVVEATAAGGANQPMVSVSVAHVARTNMVISTGTTREQSRTAKILGTAPTQAAIRVYDATPAALGADILVYTTKNAQIAPPMRPFLTTGGATVDAAMISGARNTLASPATFRIPAAKVEKGMYGLVGRLNVTTAGTLSWTARVVDSGGGATIGSGIVDAGSFEVPVTSGYRAINLAAMLLPTVEIEGNQLIEFVITGTANMTWDEFWLFNLTEGSLTWIRDADSMTWVEIRPPELGRLPSIYGGTGAFGTNPVCVDYKTIGADFGAADQHYADPGPLQIFTVTSTSLKAQTDLWFYPRYLDAVIDEAT